MSLAGMTPGEIVLASTSAAADAVGLGDEIGTLAVGKRADILVVDGDPLAAVGALRDVVDVVKNGEVVVEPDLG